MKPAEAAARAMHEWARENAPKEMLEDSERHLQPWDEIPAEVRERYLAVARAALKAAKAAKKAKA